MLLILYSFVILVVLYKRWALTQEYLGEENPAFPVFSEARRVECILYYEGPFTATVDSNFNIIGD